MDLLNNFASTYLQVRQLDPPNNQTSNLTKTLESEKSCGSRRAPEDYDLPLHIGALFLLWITSSAAAYAPLFLRGAIENQKDAGPVVTKSVNKVGKKARDIGVLFLLWITSTAVACASFFRPRAIEKQKDADPAETRSVNKKLKASDILEWTLWSARFFGTGVIIGTAFIHLLPAAHEALTDPCLPEFYTDTYTAFPEAIAMTALFIIFVVDFLSRRYVDYLRGCEQAREDPEEDARSELGSTAELHQLDRHNLVYLREHAPAIDQASIRSDLTGEQLYITDSNLNPAHVNYFREQTEKAKGTVSEYGSSIEINKSNVEPTNPDFEAEQRHVQRQEFLSILVVEAGIIFHSIFIGLTLAITSGEEFTALLISICFHQTFEGLAIGGRLGNLSRGTISWKDWKPWLSATLYGMTTPFGIAIGIAVRQDYDLSSPSSLILSGVFDSLSSGLLLYGGLVGLLSRDFTRLLEDWAAGKYIVLVSEPEENPDGPPEEPRSATKYRQYGGRICGAGIFLVALGCMAMGILGRYA